MENTELRKALEEYLDLLKRNLAVASLDVCSFAENISPDTKPLYAPTQMGITTAEISMCIS